MRAAVMVCLGILTLACGGGEPKPEPATQEPATPEAAEWNLFDGTHKTCGPLFADSHTNPPIVLGKGNSLSWFQCNRNTAEWEKLEAGYSVFDDKGECIPDNQYLYSHFFGEATEKATVGKVPDAARHFKAGGGDYELKIHFKLPTNKSNPNEIELCRKGGKCCALSPREMAPPTVPTVPTEFTTFAEDALFYKADFSRVAGLPLQFETCKRINCADE